jgi:hypothetical protein
MVMGLVPGSRFESGLHSIYAGMRQKDMCDAASYTHPFGAKARHLRFFVAPHLGKTAEFANKPGIPRRTQN